MPIAPAPARPADFDDMLALLARAALPPDGLRDHLTTTLVLRDGPTLIGCAGLEVYGREALLRSVALDPAHRGQGRGRTLIAAAEQLARDHGVQHLYLLTTTARPFFLHLGYTDFSRSDLPTSVQQSAEFGCCMCASAVAMGKKISGSPFRPHRRRMPDGCRRG